MALVMRSDYGHTSKPNVYSASGNPNTNLLKNFIFFEAMALARMSGISSASKTGASG